MSDYTTQDPIMIRKDKAARNRIVIITIRILLLISINITETKGTTARKVSGWLRNCGLRNLEGLGWLKTHIHCKSRIWGRCVEMVG